jgi:hypothetical protein
MDAEQAWAALPVRVRNLALAVAREYNHGWAFSSAVPPAGEWWEFPEEVPSLAEISDGTPEGLLGKGVAMPYVYDSWGDVFCVHVTSTRRVTIILRWSNTDGETYTVRVARPNGKTAYGTYRVEKQEFTSEAESTAWGARHVGAWRRAWKVFGLSPEFPEVLREWEFDLTEQGIPRGGRLEFATVHVREGARVNAQDLYDCARIADSVFVHGANGGTVRIVAQD